MTKRKHIHTWTWSSFCVGYICKDDDCLQLLTAGDIQKVLNARERLKRWRFRKATRSDIREAFHGQQDPSAVYIKEKRK